jgi:hypothetical protein
MGLNISVHFNFSSKGLIFAKIHMNVISPNVLDINMVAVQNPEVDSNNN